MPYKRPFQSIDVRFLDGGSLASSMSYDRIGPADFRVNDGFRRVLDSLAMREGWDYWWPNSGIAITNQKYTGVTANVLAIEEIKNPAGLSAVVAVVGSTIRRYDFATGAWVQIGSGFQTTGIQPWQIRQLNGVAYFNNGLDLPVYWRIGDSAVTPLYQLRERGVASVAYITEFNGFLMAADITEVNASYMTTLMNGAGPYGLVPTPATNTSRTQYRIIWSNATDGTDWAASVNYSGTAASNAITLSWPMASFAVGMEVTLIGGGPSGGNLVTTIATIAGTAVTVADVLSTTVSGVPISASSALGSPVGYYDIQDDGAAIVAMLPLQNRLVIYRPFSIFVGVYTGQVDFPFQFDRAYRGFRTLKASTMVVNVRGQFHLFYGGDFFYRYQLGTAEPEIDPVLAKCMNKVLAAGIDPANNFAFFADNPNTGEIFMFMKKAAPTVERMLCYDYVNGVASTVDLPLFSNPIYYSAKAVRRPLAGGRPDETTLWFIMGDEEGNITQYAGGADVMPRYGLTWTATLQSGLMDFGDAFNEKDLRTLVPLLRAPTSTQIITVKTYYANKTDSTPTLSTNTTVVPNSANPTVVPTWQRGIYHQLLLTVALNVNSPGQIFLAGYIFEVDTIGTRSVTRLK